jgi:predicted tellurium resistance membrane protein TerC
VLAAGLVLSVALMGLAANFIAKYIDRYKWIAWIGLAVILWVAGKMIYDGFVDHEVGVLKYIWPDLATRLAH